MTYILALDQGTTSSRAVIVDKNGVIVASCQKEFAQSFPQPGWVEHDPQEIWATQSAVIAEVMAKSGLSVSTLLGIGITNQRETTVLWDRKTGVPLAPAIVWQDRRTTAQCVELKKQKLEPVFRQKTGLFLDPYFSGTKLSWLLKNVPGARERAKRGELAFGTIDTWLAWKLSGGKLHITDVTNASRTLLFNIHTCRWDEELLSILEIPPSLLPTIRSSSEVYGYTDTSLFSKPLPLAALAGDQQAALFGQACFHPGMVKTTYGTGCFLLLNTGEKPILSSEKLLTTLAYQREGKTFYALEGSVFIGGAVVQWLRDGLKIIRASSEIETLAASVPDTEGVYFVPAFTGLGAPYWNPSAKGTIFGLTRGSTSAHIARAALEGIAFQVRDVLKAMEKDAGIPLGELRVDGGAVRSDLLMQFQADILQLPVIRPQVSELTALGAAYLAGLALKFWENEEEISSYWKQDKRFTPQFTRLQAEERCTQWKKAVDCTRAYE